MQIDFQSHLYQIEESIDLLSNVSFGLSEHNMYKSNELTFKDTFLRQVNLCFNLLSLVTCTYSLLLWHVLMIVELRGAAIRGTLNVLLLELAFRPLSPAEQVPMSLKREDGSRCLLSKVKSKSCGENFTVWEQKILLPLFSESIFKLQ